jgi:transposase-like protein
VPDYAILGARSKRQISEAELSRWRLVEEFEKRLERAAAVGKEPHTFSDPRRTLGQKDYLSLLLFGLFNPVVVRFLRFCGHGLLEIRKEESLCKSNSTKFARRYDREFKENAVALIQSGRSITEVSRDLGVSHWSLSRWLKDAQSGQVLSEPRTLSSETPEQRELRRLRQENDYLRRQRDILKKACSILSAEVQPSDLR